MKTPEEQFVADNGMSSEAAFSLVTKWEKRGKKDEARRGCEEILKIFPDHDGAKSILARCNSPFLGAQHSEKKEGLFDKFQKTVGEKAEAVTKKVKQKKDDFVNKRTQKAQSKEKESASQHALERVPSLSEKSFEESSAEAVTDDDRLWGMMGYVWIFCIIPLLLKRDSEFVQFHAWQGLVLTILFTLFSILVLGVLSVLFTGFGIFRFLFQVTAIAIYAAAGFSAYKGKWFHLPLVSSLSERFRKKM